jgi:hypothetical protein
MDLMNLNKEGKNKIVSFIISNDRIFKAKT